MKKSLLVILLFALGAFNNINAISYVSAGVGPADWHTATSWTPNGVPTINDDVTILATHEITFSTRPYCKDFTCSGIIRWLVSSATNGTFTVKGDYSILSGGSEQGTGFVQFNPPGANITCFGTTSQNVYYSLYNSRTVTAGSTIDKYLTTIKFQPNVTLTNLGTVSTGISVLCTSNNTWTNGTNSSVLIRNTGFMSGQTFNASATGNTVLTRYFSGNLPTVVGGIYYNLRLIAPGIGAKKLVQTTIVQNNFTASTNNTLNTNNFNMSVGGNWTSSGALLATAGNTITFNGTSAQTISNTVGTTTFTGLTIDNTAGVTFTTGSYVIDEVLTLSNGTLSTGGRTVVLTSTATKTARIAPVTGTGAVSGNFTINRHISGRDTTYCDLSSPVNNSTFLDWDNELPAISYVPPVSGTSQGSASTYDETGDVWVAVTSSSQPLLPGQGFEVYLAGSFSYAAFPTTTLTTVGEPTVGDQDFSSLVSANSQGWNLVGNPYASSISWASVYAASGGATSGLFDYIEMFDYTINDWADVTADDEIASTQGFWVYSDFSTTPSLFILESCKTNTTVFDIRAGKKSAPYFTLKLANSANTCAHNFKVAATADAFDGYDRKDLPFRNSPVKATPAMYAMVDGKKINTNTFNSNNDSYSMPLKTQVSVSGTYKITASGFEYVADYTCIKLQDKLTGQIIDLNEGNGYCFTMNTTDSPDRFILLFSKDSNCKSAITAASPNVDFSNQVEVLPSAQGNVVNFNLGETTNTTISVLNVLGQTIVEGINLDATTQSVNVTLPADFSGLYFVKIESAKGTITKKFVRK